jgi:murein DD-endopeptidase MepM/ murein hydrolase activator NlpD
MGPTAEKIKKSLSRQLTVMLIPHSDFQPIRLNFSIAFIVFLAVGWTGITVWSGFIASRHVNYWKAKADESVLRAKVWYFSQEMKKTREYLDRVRETEIALQNLLNMKSRKAIVQNDPNALGGPSGTDQRALIDLMSGRRVDPTLDEINSQLQNVNKTQSELISNFEEISKYITDQREVYRATPVNWPTEGRITSGYGARKSPFDPSNGDFHQGLDIANKLGTPVFATADGTVQVASWQGGYGRLIVIDHGRGFRTYYGHNSELLVQKGDHVRRGQMISKMGTSGHSTGYHLHYEVWHNGRVTNPMKFVKATINDEE